MTSTTPTPSPTTVNDGINLPSPSLLQDVSIINHASTAPCPCCNQIGGQCRRNTVEHHEDDDSGYTQAGVLNSAISYTPRKTLAEGYVHLKGSGKDWIGSRSWKSRYARLVLATVEGVEAPLLLIYWFQSSIEPSTVITLDSTVVLPVEKPDKEAWNAHCLEVIHVTSRGEQRVTRTFTAGSAESRDAWLLVLNQCLLQYEKCKAYTKKCAASTNSTPQKPSPAKSNGERFADDRFPPKPGKPSPACSSASSPPLSPRSSEKLPLPRPADDTLAGESLIA